MIVQIFKYFNCEPFRIFFKDMKDVKIIETTPRDTLDIVKNIKPHICMIPITSICKICKYDYTVSNICIACRGPVRSVGIFYKEPINIEAIDKIYAIEESSVSIKIIDILFKRILNRSIDIENIKISKDNIEHVLNRRPTLLIGDMALEAYLKYYEIVDIGDVWYRIFKRPLIFSILIYRDYSNVRKVVEDIETMLRHKYWIDDIECRSSHYLSKTLPKDLIYTYFSRNLIYILDIDDIYESIIFELKLLNLNCCNLNI